MSPPPGSAASQEWTILYYLCGHFHRTGTRDPFLAALDEIRAVGATPHTSVAAYLDLESGARRMALRAGETVESESLGAANSGDPRTLAGFLSWAFDACPAKRYVLVMAGLGILDADSVVGRPPFDMTRTFAICDDRATDDAIELHELSETLRAAFPADARRRLVMLACDMYAMQFMEVAYELQSAVDVLVGIQPDEHHDAPSLHQWPYGRLLRLWQELLAATPEGAQPRWRTGIDAHATVLARETIRLLGEHYGTADDSRPVTVSAINLPALTPLAQALDTFSAVYLQWLSNDVLWRARERVFSTYRDLLNQAWSYDVWAVADAVARSLDQEIEDAPGLWVSEALPSLPYAQLSRALRMLATVARDVEPDDPQAAACAQVARDVADCRAALERSVTPATPAAVQVPPEPIEVKRIVGALFADTSNHGRVRNGAAWARVVSRASGRFDHPQAAELADILDGLEAARQIARLARRVCDLARPSETSKETPALIDIWPKTGRCGLSLYRPVDLDRLAVSNYLQLRFSKDLHWTALLTAVDLINNHARMLWRLLESQLTAAPLEARYQLMRRLAGDRALTGRHADQLRALSAPSALFLTIEPADPALQTLAARPGPSAASEAGANDPIVSYCVRLNSLDRSATVVERRNPVPRERLERLLAEIDAIGSATTSSPADMLQRLARCGSMIGDDILYGISERLTEVEGTDGRPVHLVLQLPRELMRYPWELLRDRGGWLVERFAIGRQVIADADSIPRWFTTRRQGALRFLVVAPSRDGCGDELGKAGVIEGEHVAECFDRLKERLPGLVDPANYHEFVGQPVTIESFRTMLREGRYDLVHFAGHGRYDPVHPERSCWLFSDGPLYAFELRHTLANAEVTPWLLYGSACEGSREATGGSHGYHDGIYGMASAALGQGVAAYIGPLWKIADADAKNMAAAFYEALLLRRASVGESLALARRHLRDAGSAGWTGMVLYGDPTPTILQRLSPSDPAITSNQAREPKGVTESVGAV